MHNSKILFFFFSLNYFFSFTDTLKINKVASEFKLFNISVVLKYNFDDWKVGEADLSLMKLFCRLQTWNVYLQLEHLITLICTTITLHIHHCWMNFLQLVFNMKFNPFLAARLVPQYKFEPFGVSHTLIVFDRFLNLAPRPSVCELIIDKIAPF